MTRDKVTLRLSMTVEYAVENPALATHAVTSVKDAVYSLVQLAARLRVRCDSRSTAGGPRRDDAVPRAAHGARCAQVRRTHRARRRQGRGPSAAANVILRREETAAIRSLANTAHVMAEQPVLLRLKELEALKEIASHIHEVRVVVGADGLKTLLPAGLLGNGGKVEPKPGE